MPTMTKRAPAPRGKASTAPTKGRDNGPPLLLKTEEEVAAYLAEHLTPVRRGPKGQPIYAQKDIEKLNVRLYADD
ncbi:MAG TPA: hypothetical protein VKX17_12385 [Planctomycetota bacterium]|nr:hypothetical protein [Planctomycetota bacterium]